MVLRPQKGTIEKVDEIKSANFPFIVVQVLSLHRSAVSVDGGADRALGRANHAFNAPKAILMCAIVVLLGRLISRYHARLGASASASAARYYVRARGKFEPIQISSTHDEIQYLGEASTR